MAHRISHLWPEMNRKMRGKGFSRWAEPVTDPSSLYLHLGCIDIESRTYLERCPRGSQRKGSSSAAGPASDSGGAIPVRFFSGVHNWRFDVDRLAAGPLLRPDRGGFGRRRIAPIAGADDPPADPNADELRRRSDARDRHASPLAARPGMGPIAGPSRDRDAGRCAVDVLPATRLSCPRARRCPAAGGLRS